MPLLRRLISNNGLWGIFGQVSAAGFGALSYVLLARMLAPQELGSFILFGSFGIIASLVFQFGLSRTGFILGAKASGEDRRDEAGTTMARLAALLLLSLCLFGAFHALFGRSVAAYIVPEGADLGVAFILIFVVVAANLVLTSSSELLKGLGCVKRQVLVGQVVLPASLLAIFGLLYARSSNFALIELLSVQTSMIAAAGLVLAALVAALFAGRRGTQEAGAKRSGPSLNAIMAVAFPVWVTNIVFLVETQLDVWIVSAALTATDVAAYGLALRLTVLIVLPQRGIEGAIAHLIVRAHSNSNDFQKQNVAHSAALICFLIAAPPAIAMILFPGFLLETLFTAELAYAAPALAILAAGRLAAMALGVGQICLFVCGYQKLFMKISLVNAFNQIVLVSLGCVAFGLVGAAMGNAIAVLVGRILFAYLSWSKLGIRPFFRWNAQALSAIS